MKLEKLAREFAIEAIADAAAIQAELYENGHNSEISNDTIRRDAKQFTQDSVQELIELVLQQIDSIEFNTRVQVRVSVELGRGGRVLHQNL